MWLAGDMNYSPKPAQSGEVKNILQQYLLLHARCKYHKVTEMDADDLAARQDLEDMIGSDKVKEINGLLHDIVMTGRIGDGKVLENTKHVMDQLAQILQLAGVGQNSQQDQSGQGQSDQSQQGDQSQNQQGQDSQSQGQSDSSNSQQSQEQQGQQGQPAEGAPDAQTQADADDLRCGNGTGKSVVNWDPDASMSEGTQLAKDLAKDLADAVAKAERQADKEGTMSEVSAESTSGHTEVKDAQPHDANLPVENGQTVHPADPSFEGAQMFRARLTQQTLARRSFETGGIKKWAKAYRQSMTGIRPTADTRRTMSLSQDRGHDVDILLDASGSMSRDGKRDAAITAAWGIHHALLGVPNVTARVLSFRGVVSDTVETIIPVRGRASFTEAVKKYTVRGGTPTAEAVVESTKGLLSRPGKAKLMLIVTDGAADSPDSCRKAIVRAKRMGIRVVMIGIMAGGATDSYKDICPVVEVEDVAQLRAEMLRQLAKNI